MDYRKRAEDELKTLAYDVDRYKLSYADREAQDLNEIKRLKAQLSDMKYQMEDLIRQQSIKDEESSLLSKDIMSWREVVDRLSAENTELKTVIEELENKNRRLVDKLNEQIYNKATEYKERTL